jgi:hypothetical protein
VGGLTPQPLIANRSTRRTTPTNLPGNHISQALPLTIAPGAAAAGLIAVPTTGGNLTILNGLGATIGTLNLVGEHIGQMIEFGVFGDVAVQTTGGNLAIVTAGGFLMGTINLPGEHFNGAPMVIGGGPAGGNLLLLNQNNQIFMINAAAAPLLVIGVGDTV